MNRRNKIIIIISGIGLIVALAAFLASRKNTTTEIQPPTETKVAIPTRRVDDYFSDTGAVYISPTDNEYTEIELIKILRSKVPIKNEGFSVDFDYKVNKFIVTITDGSQNNKDVFEKWLSETGYNQISSQYWQVE